MERKVVTGILKALDEKGSFVARVVRLNAIDKDGDVTRPGAFGNDQVAPILVGHNWGTIPLGKARLTEEGEQVLARGQLNLKTPDGRDLYEALKFDAAHPPSTTQFSYGFTLVKSSFGDHVGRRVRFLESIKVHEISVVIAGAGDTALLTVKQGNDLAARTAEAVTAYWRLRERMVKAR